MHKNDEGYEFNWLNAGVSLAHATLFGAFSGVVNNGISKIFSSKADFAAGVFVSSVSSVGTSCVDFADRQIITSTTSDYQKKDRIQKQKQTTSQRASRWQRRYAAGHGPVPVLVGG